MKAYEVREAIGHGQLVVRMRAAALNYREQGVIKGAYGYTKFPLALAAYNLIRLPRLLAVPP